MLVKHWAVLALAAEQGVLCMSGVCWCLSMILHGSSLHLVQLLLAADPLSSACAQVQMEHVNAVVDALTVHAADKPGSGALDPKAGHLAACCKLLV